MPTVLVTGGAGYVGSQSVLHFKELGWRVLVLDNLSTGHHRFAQYSDLFCRADLINLEEVRRAIGIEPLDGIVHCAARSLVPESIREPVLYFRENINGALNLIQAAGPIPIVFSSSAATYGEPSKVPIAEDATAKPVNAYGFSKLAIEQALAFSGEAYGTRSVCLRYFNAAGADPKGRVGEHHAPETHLIPNLIKVAQGQLGSFKQYGADYPTPDGSCVRDCVHTLDIAKAHEAALRYLWGGGSATTLNIGSGTGFSVREVLGVVNELAERPVAVEVCERRKGDPASLVADISKAAQVLGWRPQHSTLKPMIETAWAWHAHP